MDMEMNDLMILIITILPVCVGVFFTYFHFKKGKEGEIEAKQFLDGLKETLYNKMLDIIKNFNYEDYEDLVGIEVSIINSMTLAAKDYINNTLKQSTDVLSILAQKVLTDEFIEKFIDTIINKIDLPGTIELQLGDKFERFNKEIEEEDKKLTDEYSDGKVYFKNEDEISEVEDLSIPNLEELITTNDVEIIPHKDDEEAFNAEDSSMEIVPDSTTYVDSKGRVHDKTTGKFIKLELEIPEDTEEEE